MKTGEILFVRHQPDIASRLQSSEANARTYEARLSSLLADPAGLAEDAVTRQRLKVQFEEARAARSEIARLNLQTPFAGIWLDVDPQWQPGQWIGRQEPLGVLIDPRSWQVDAYVAQDQVHRLVIGDEVRFYPDGQPQPLTGHVIQIGSTRAGQLSHRMLSSRFGGPVATTAAEHALIPSAALFQVLIQLDQAPASQRETRGHLKIDGVRRSVLAEGATHLVAIARAAFENPEAMAPDQPATMNTMIGPHTASSTLEMA